MRLLTLAGAGVAAVLLAALLVAMLLAPSPAATDAERAARLAGQLRCPDCQALSVAESRTNAANAIRREIEAQVAAGHSDEEVRRHFVDRYGEWILLSPTDPLAWWLPVGVVLAATAAFAGWLLLARRARGSAAPPSSPAPVTDAERRRISEELEALDG